MRASQLQDPLYEPEPFDFDRPDPMRPIRLQYVTLTAEKRLLADTCERLGLAHAWVGVQLHALNECDTTRIRLDARQELAAEGIAEPSEDAVARRVERLLTALVIAQRVTVTRSALHHASVAVEKVAQEMRASADAELLAHGVDMKARIANAVSEYEAA
jgi:hypothetical protein